MSQRFAIITDTTADLPPDLAAERGIYMIPQVIIWGRQEFKDGVTITSPEFYQRLASADEMPTTSRPAPADVAALCQQARDETDAEAVVVITVSEEVSGTYPSTQEALKEVDFPVHVLDTRTISLALGMVALRVAEARDSGASPAEGLAAAKQAASASHALFTPGTLDYLRRGGRIGGASHLIGTALSIKPILTLVDGRVQSLENVRTRKRAIKRLLELIEERADPQQPLWLGVVHGDAQAEADALAATIQERWDPALLLKGWVSPSIGVHVGPGVLGVMISQ